MEYLYPVKPKIEKTQHEQLLNQCGKVIWFTGLSGAGKTTLAVQLEAELFDRSFKTCLLDGDNIRTGLNKDLNFTDVDRKENIRRIGEVCKLFIDSGVIVLAAFISPFREDRDNLKSLIGKDNFIEIFLNVPLEICEQRDIKGIYKKARTGHITNLTGIHSPYEIPEDPDLEISNDIITIEQSIDLLLTTVLSKITLVHTQAIDYSVPGK